MTALTADPVFSGVIHAFAARFPMLPDDELADLADDIRAHGQLHPIVLDPAGVLLDGRNRLAACELAGVEPWFTVHDGWPAALIVSANVRRRQMMPGQVAMAAAIGLVEQGLRVNGRWKKGVASKLANASEFGESTLRLAGVVLDYDEDRGTDYADQVLSGTPTLAEAYKIVAGARRKEADAADAANAANREASEHAARVQAKYAELRASAPDLAELVRLEKLPLDEAVAAWEKRKLEQSLAHQEACNAWREAHEALVRACSYLANGYRPPADLPASYPQPADFLRTLSSIIDLSEGMS